ncbi:MAG: hypothetical protein VX737_06295 [Pseudomonadota bacterium]|nr:hypothetical protein [Pseudomonadota bacterium]
MKRTLKIFLLALVVSANNPKFVAGNLHRKKTSSSKTSSSDFESATTSEKLRSPVVEMTFDYKMLEDVVDKMKATQNAMETLKRQKKNYKNEVNKKDDKNGVNKKK